MKFEEYIKESKEIDDILSYEEVGEQFLRLKEVLHCVVGVQLIYAIHLPEKIINTIISILTKHKYGFVNPFTKQVYRVEITPKSLVYSDDVVGNSKILDELNRIKRRMEIEFPVKIIIKNLNIGGFFNVTISKI